MTATITIFTKPDCPHCTKAKAILDKAGLAYVERDVAQSRRDADASIYFSGSATLPQIFVGDVHVNGASDLQALREAGHLPELAGAASGTLPMAEVDDGELARGAEDLVLREVIPERDGTRDEDPDSWAILHFYRQFFGFWPNCFYFMHHWPEAYKLFVYCHNLDAIGGSREAVGMPVMMAAGFATSAAHGCSYCMVHLTAAGGEQSLNMDKLVAAARAGNAPAQSPIGPFELALVDIAADATRNTVAPKQLEALTALVPQARTAGADPQASITAMAMLASAFGFLNTFNDLTGVEIEAEWAAQARAATGIEAGRHGVSEHRSSTNLDHDLPQGGPSIGDIIGKYEAIVAEAGGVEAYARQELGLWPSWMAAWPEHLRARHAYLYVELMQPRAHSPIPSELKHLAARVSAIARGHDYLAAVEGFFAHRAAGQTERSLARIRHAFAAAKGGIDGGDLFTDREVAALKLAWLSAQTPLTTPRRFIEPAVAAFTPTELVHVITVCAVAGLVQRFVAIAKPEMEPETARFMRDNGLATDTLAVRYRLAS